MMVNKESALARAVEALELRRLLSTGVAVTATEAAGSLVARPAGNTGTGFFVANGKVYDATGHQFVIRGFNHTTQFGDDSKNIDAISEFAKTGANAVRAVMGTFGAAATPAQRQSVVQQYLDEGIVPIVEDQSATGSNTVADLQAITNNWLQSGNVTWLKANERNVILNIANEWGPDSTVWRDAYISMISQLRTAGINALIMIDSGQSGQNINTLKNYAQQIENADPQHNIVFDLHMYNFWTTGSNAGTNSSPAGSPWSVATELQNLQKAGIPVVVGEYSMTDGTSTVPYDTKAAMTIFNQLGIGSLAWSWNQNQVATHNMLSQSAGWQYDNASDLSAFGNLVINDPTVGLKATAIPAASLRPATVTGTLTLNGVNVSGPKIYIDDNNNGKLDSGELWTTVSKGTFSFTNLPQGVERLRVQSDPNSPITAPMQVVTLPAGETASVTMLAQRVTSSSNSTSTGTTAQLSGILFNDISRDGYQQAGETAVAGYTVYIDLDNDGSPDNSDPVAITGSDGTFSFSGLTPGTYAVSVVLPDGSERTSSTLPLTLKAGDIASNVKIGVDNPPAVGSLAGSLFKDSNLNGTLDSGEGGYAYRFVYLDLNNNGKQDTGEPTAFAEADGSYMFSRLTPGTYSVGKVDDGLLVTTSLPTATVSAFQTTTVAPIGIMWKPGTLGGIVYNDANSNAALDSGETNAAGITVFIDANHNGVLDTGETTTVTNDSGYFEFDGVASGQTYIGAVAPDGQVMTTGDAGFYVNSGQTYTSLKIGVGVASTSGGGTTTPPTTTPTNAVISGVYYNDANANQMYDTGETGVSGATVFLDTNGNNLLDAGEPTTVTNTDGTYSFTGLAAGTYHLRTIPPAGMTTSTPQTDVYLAASQNFNIANIGIVKAAPLPAVATLEGETGKFGGTTYSASNHTAYTGTGFADFGGTGSSATYTITRSQSGTAALQFRYANGGTVARTTTVIVNGVTIGTLGGASTGNWDTWKLESLNASLINGANTIQLIAADNNGGINLDSISVVDTTAATTAGTAPSTASIGGTVFTDDDGDGKFNGVNAFLSGATVFLDTNNNGILDAGEASTTTSAGGGWFFTGLSSGTYHVRAVLGANQKISSTLIDLTLADGQASYSQTIGLMTVSPTVQSSVYINAGGSVVGNFAADNSYTGGTAYSVSNSIITTGVSNPAPPAVYQSERYGNFTYTIGNLVAGSVYNVQLDFAENYFSAAGKRLFNATANGQAILTNFDIFAAAGGRYRAVNQTAKVTADANGKITLGFVSIVDNAKVNGIEITPAS